MSEKKQVNILHFFSKTKDKIINENSNTSLNSEHINDLIVSISMSISMNQNIHNPHQAALERRFKLEAKRKNAKYQENIIQST